MTFDLEAVRERFAALPEMAINDPEHLRRRVVRKRTEVGIGRMAEADGSQEACALAQALGVQRCAPSDLLQHPGRRQLEEDYIARAMTAEGLRARSTRWRLDIFAPPSPR